MRTQGRSRSKQRKNQKNDNQEKDSGKRQTKGPTTQELQSKDVVKEDAAPKEIKAVPTTQGGEEEEEGTNEPS